MTQIPSTRVDWVKTQTNLAKYSSNDKMWLRRVVTSEGEFLEAKKVTIGMRFMHIFGAWRLPDVVNFLSSHVDELPNHVPEACVDKLKLSVMTYNDHSIIRKKIPVGPLDNIATVLKKTLAPTDVLIEIPVVNKNKADLVKAKELISNDESFAWILTVTSKTKYLNEKITDLKESLNGAPQPLQEPFITIKHIVKRFDQLIRVDIEHKGPTGNDRFRLAVYIEMSLPKIVETAKTTFVKANKEVPRDVAFLKNRQIVVMAKSTTSKLKAEGSYKKVFSAAMVPLKRKEAPVGAVQAHIKPTAAELENVEHELEIFKELEGVPGFVKMHTYCTLPTASRKEIPQYRVVFEAFQCSLLKLTSKNPPVPTTFEQKIDIAKQVLQAMTIMHQRNLVHLDLKIENVLFRFDGDKPVAGVTDFGFTTRTDTSKIKVSEFITNACSYGSPFATAPELIGNTKFLFTKDNLENLDVWACGTLLHELLIGEPSWHVDLRTENDLTSKIHRIVKKKVESDIEGKLAKLEKKDNLTDSEKIQKIIFQMMRLNPKDRISMQEALDALLTNFNYK